MIENRKFFIAFLMTVVLCLTWVQAGYASEEIYKVVSPKHLDRLHTFPVRLAVEFDRGARPATFNAILNGVDITGKFIETGNGMRALINPEDGLRIDVNKDVPQNINVLRTKVEGLQPEQYVEHETLFFVEVDSLMVIGPEGGKIQSPDSRLLLDIPPYALSGSTTIALTRVDSSGHRVHGSGQAEPKMEKAEPAVEPEMQEVEPVAELQTDTDIEPAEPAEEITEEEIKAEAEPKLEEVEPAAELQDETEIEPAEPAKKIETAKTSGVIYQLAPYGISLDRPFTITMKYDPADLPQGVGAKDFFLLSGKEFPEKLKNVFVDESAQTIRATDMSFSRIVMSYYMKIGKKTAIPPAASFRLPIGDNSDPYYSCGLDYQKPSANDLGEIFPLLQRSSHADSDYPSIIFNENGRDNAWHVITAFNRNRHINDSNFLYPADETMFSNGEDWYFTGHRKEYQRLPVHAVADGLIIYNGQGYGNAIVVEHRLPAGPILSVYSHLDEKSLCPVGSVIHKGNVIGTIGRVGGGPPYLHFEIGRQSLIREDAETGETKAPAFWFGQWHRDEVYENYYDPTNFLLNIRGKYKWDFNVNGNDEGWIAVHALESDSHDTDSHDTGGVGDTASATDTTHILFENFNFGADSATSQVIYSINGTTAATTGADTGHIVISNATYTLDVTTATSAYSFTQNTVPGSSAAQDENLANLYANGIDLTVVVEDGNGNRVTHNIHLDVNVLDDIPTLTDSTESVTLDEDGLAENVKKYENGYTYTYQVSNGLLSVEPRSGNLQLISYPLRLEAEIFDSVFIRMKNNGFGGRGRVSFATAEMPGYSEDKSIQFDVLDDDQFHEYRVYMAGNQDWQGTIVGIRLDFLDTAIGETAAMDFDSIRLGRDYLSPTPDTGQSKCYNNSREIACPAPDEPFYGQDATYVINPPNYEIKTINGDEVVIDHVTGLTWQRQEDGIKRTWYEAMDYSNNLALAGYSDWRYPTWKELQSMANYGSLDSADFVYSAAAPDDCYWSATIPSFPPPSAPKACFRNNQITIGDKNEKNYVRAVRGRTLEFGHFRDNGDGTVTDITTGLMWAQTETRAMPWEKALAFSEDLDLAGFHDWRLPTIRELSRLIDGSRREPSIDTASFPGCRPSVYWSSTTHALYPGFAWHVRFGDGMVQAGQKGRRYYVRAVRGGKSP